MAGKLLNRCSTSLVIREIQIKNTGHYDITPTRMAQMKRIPRSGEEVEWQ